jgi:nitrite reductase/ring-hydroxylating ferredoxin subunit
MGMLFKKDTEWREAATESEFAEQDRKLLDFGGELQVGLYKVEGEYFAVSAWCSHQKASMVHGDVEGHELMCPVHGARFDLKTGKNLSLPAVRPVASYPVKIENGRIYVKV